MTPIEQFMSEYFRDRTELILAEIERRSPHRQKYFVADCRWDSRKGTVESSQSEQIVSVSEADGETVVVTSDKKQGTIFFPLRYHLRPNGASWLIHLVEFQCPSCHGSGIGVHGGGACVICGGKGWT